MIIFRTDSKKLFFRFVDCFAAIFGPTDTAFGDVSNVIAGLDEAGLADALAGHVVASVFTAQDVINGGCSELTTLSGSSVRVWHNDGVLTVNGSTVIQADVVGDGGVLHGIDKVILSGTFESCPEGTMKGSKKGSKKSSKKGYKKGYKRMRRD